MSQRDLEATVAVLTALVGDLLESVHELRSRLDDQEPASIKALNAARARKIAERPIGANPMGKICEAVRHLVDGKTHDEVHATTGLHHYTIATLSDTFASTHERLRPLSKEDFDLAVRTVLMTTTGKAA